MVADRDGTIASCVRHLLGGRAAMAPVPGGTRNRMAKRLGQPTEPLAAVAALAAGRLDVLDVAEMSGRRFLHQATVGNPVGLGRFRDMQRRGRGWGLLRSPRGGSCGDARGNASVPLSRSRSCGQDPFVQRVETDALVLRKPTSGTMRVSLDGEAMLLPLPLRGRLHRGTLRVLRA